MAHPVGGMYILGEQCNNDERNIGYKILFLIHVHYDDISLCVCLLAHELLHCSFTSQARVTVLASMFHA